MSATIGDARTIRPTAAGIVSISIMRSALEIVCRTPANSDCAAYRDTAGSVAVAIETPNRPMGRYMSLNA
jgi:hypothetical protein